MVKSTRFENLALQDFKFNGGVRFDRSFPLMEDNVRLFT